MNPNKRGTVTALASDRSVIIDSKRTENTGYWSGAMVRVTHDGVSFATAAKTNVLGKIVLLYSLPFALSLGDEYEVGNLAAEVNSPSCSLRLDSRVRWLVRVEAGDDYAFGGGYSEVATDPQVDYVRIAPLVPAQRLLSAVAGGAWTWHAAAVNSSGTLYAVFGDLIDSPAARLRLRRIGSDGSVGVADQQLTLTHTPNSGTFFRVAAFDDGSFGVLVAVDDSGWKLYWSRFNSDGTSETSTTQVASWTAPLVAGYYNLCTVGDVVHVVFSTIDPGVAHTLTHVRFNKDGSSLSSESDLIDVESPSGISDVACAVVADALVVAFVVYDGTLLKKLYLGHVELTAGGLPVESTWLDSVIDDAESATSHNNVELIPLTGEVSLCMWLDASIDLEFSKFMLLDPHSIGVLSKPDSLGLNIAGQPTRGSVCGGVDGSNVLALAFATVDDAPTAGDVSTYYLRARVEEVNTMPMGGMLKTMNFLKG